MATVLFVRGLDPVTLSEEHSFDGTRRRVQTAKKLRKEFELGKSEQFYSEGDAGKLVFDTAQGGKIWYDTDDVFGVGQS